MRKKITLAQGQVFPLSHGAIFQSTVTKNREEMKERESVGTAIAACALFGALALSAYGIGVALGWIIVQIINSYSNFA